MFRARHDSVVPTRSLFRSAAQLGFSRVLLSHRLAPKGETEDAPQGWELEFRRAKESRWNWRAFSPGSGAARKSAHCSVMFILARWAITRYDCARRGIMHVTVYQSNRISPPSLLRVSAVTTPGGTHATPNQI